MTKTWERPTAPARTCTPDLTPDEMVAVRRALHFLRTREGSTAKLARALGVQPWTVGRALAAKGKPVASLALRVAGLAHVPVEDALSGAFPAPSACPHCGRG